MRILSVLATLPLLACGGGAPRADRAIGNEASPPPEEEATPEGPPAPPAAGGDRDGDGVVDDRDLCPADPEDRDGFEDEDGCPDPDNDRDGILDVQDQCPNEPEIMDGQADTDGCPP